MTVLVTGGAGYIGSHAVLLLLEHGQDVVVIDNLANSHRQSLQRVAELAGREAVFVHGDIRDRSLLDELFRSHPIASVIHFAGLKSVGESVSQPLEYYDNNVVGTVRLLQAMDQVGVRRLVFSSSATVYGEPASVPIREDFPLSYTNPYGATKLHIEDMLRDLHQADSRWRIALLRYFNPVGAHPSGRIGESPNGVPNNLMPYITQVAVGQRESLSVFGSDYPTIDGTGVRDYIHVMDLVEGHLAALLALDHHSLLTCNLGTGVGYSVLQMVAAFEKATGRRVPYRLVDRRPGDVAECYADPSLAATLMGWRATRGLDEMCRDHGKWQFENPRGFEG
jgi:UDP-glucose 4-epimerase